MRRRDFGHRRGQAGPLHRDGMNLNTLASVFRLVHIGAGALALLSFWIPLVARKGGRLHRNAGRFYASTMGLVATSTLVIVSARLSDRYRANDAFALFLGYIALLSASSAWSGIRAVRTQTRSAPSRAFSDLVLPISVLVCGCALLAHAIFGRQLLFALFALLGIATSLNALRFWLRSPAPGDFLLQHISGMSTSCIATVTAFLVVIAPRLGIPRGNLLVWVTPAVIGGVAIARTLRKYRKPTPCSAPPRARAEL